MPKVTTHKATKPTHDESASGGGVCVCVGGGGERAEVGSDCRVV